MLGPSIIIIEPHGRGVPEAMLKGRSSRKEIARKHALIYINKQIQTHPLGIGDYFFRFSPAGGGGGA